MNIGGCLLISFAASVTGGVAIVGVIVTFI
jgi:hypothetical protein